jgi:hypothetical protein
MFWTARVSDTRILSRRGLEHGIIMVNTGTTCWAQGSIRRFSLKTNKRRSLAEFTLERREGPGMIPPGCLSSACYVLWDWLF